MIVIRKAIYAGMVCCVLCGTVNAQGMMLKVDKVTVKQAMDELKEKSGYTFVFSSSDLDTGKIISVFVENKGLEEAVRQILSGQDVTYEIKEKNIIVRNIVPVRGDGG